MAEPSTATRHILIVDDRDYVRSFYRRVFETVRYSVDEASNCRDALRAVNGRDYILTLTRINLLGDQDGIDFIVSAGLTAPKQKILVIEDPDLLDKHLNEIEDRANVVGCVESPVNQETLLRLVKPLTDAIQ